MGQFAFTTSADPERAVVVLVGDCDLAVRDQLTTLLLDLVQSAPVVAVDLSSVTFMDSSGLHALMTAHHAAQHKGRRLYVSGATGVVAGLLDITGLRAILNPAPSDRDTSGDPTAPTGDHG